MQIENGWLVRVDNRDKYLLMFNPKKFWKGITGIGQEAFAKLNWPRKITIPGSVKIIDDSAFYLNEALMEVNIQEGVEEIGCAAFCECRNLAKINIPNSVNKIDGLAFAKTALTSLKIPGSAKDLGVEILWGNNKIIDVEIGEGIEYIPGEMFQFCTSLQRVSIPKSVQKIYAFAFYGCDSMKQIYTNAKEIEHGNNVVVKSIAEKNSSVGEINSQSVLDESQPGSEE